MYSCVLPDRKDNWFPPKRVYKIPCCNNQAAETWTKTRGPTPGGSILTHTHLLPVQLSQILQDHGVTGHLAEGVRAAVKGSDPLGVQTSVVFSDPGEKKGSFLGKTSFFVGPPNKKCH